MGNGGSTFYNSISQSINFTVQGNTFNNVEVLHVKDSLYNDSSRYYSSTCFFNDSVCFLKMQIDYNNGVNKIYEVLELKRWHLIK
jgi:hypothetical protein